MPPQTPPRALLPASAGAMQPAHARFSLTCFSPHSEPTSPPANLKDTGSLLLSSPHTATWLYRLNVRWFWIRSLPDTWGRGGMRRMAAAGGKRSCSTRQAARAKRTQPEPDPSQTPAAFAAHSHAGQRGTRTQTRSASLQALRAGWRTRWARDWESGKWASGARAYRGSRRNLDKLIVAFHPPAQEDVVPDLIGHVLWANGSWRIAIHVAVLEVVRHLVRGG